MGQVQLGLCHDLGLVFVSMSVLGLVYGSWHRVLDLDPGDSFDFGHCLSLGLGLDHNHSLEFSFGLGFGCRLVKHKKIKSSA